jgi:hypothetical protein
MLNVGIKVVSGGFEKCGLISKRWFQVGKIENLVQIVQVKILLPMVGLVVSCSRIERRNDIGEDRSSFFT